MSKAYSKFKKTICRCEDLVNTYLELNKLPSSYGISPNKDIVRGAVILAVSALDAYVTDVFSEKFITYMKTKTPDKTIIDLLSAAGLDTKTALDLIKMDRPYRRIRTLIDKYYCRYTTQNFRVIDDIFKIYHLQNITANAEKMTGRTTIRDSVRILIERRHEIAHNGDYDKFGRVKDIDEKSILKRIKDLGVLVTNMDTLIDKKIPIKSN